MTPRPDDDRPDIMDWNIHRTPRSFVARVKSHAAKLGLSMKSWVMGVLQRAMDRDDASRASSDGDELYDADADADDDATDDDAVAPDDTVSPETPRGRRDLPPGGDGGSSTNG